MAKLSHGRARRLAFFAIAFTVLSSTSALADDAGREGLDLIGTWHVLIHYTDDHSHDPSLMRWDDKIWVFEETGSRLRWTEYPIVVFRDQSGRFERLGGARAARVVHGWEPNESQRAQIAAGLEVNPRGSKSKKLRKQKDGSWRTASRPLTSGARVVTYIENWSIEAPTSLPVFRREDSLGSAATESFEGATEFATSESNPEKGVLRGRFERDGSRHGTFRLTRSGSATDVKGKSKSEGQRFFEMYLAEGFRADELPSNAEIEARAKPKEGKPAPTHGEIRSSVRSDIRAVLEENLRDQDLDPREFEREIASLAQKIMVELVEEGRSRAEVEQMLAEGEINP